MWRGVWSGDFWGAGGRGEERVLMLILMGVVACCDPRLNIERSFGIGEGMSSERSPIGMWVLFC